MSEKEKYLQVKTEAAATGVFLLALIVFWCAAGFGLSDLEGEIFSLPIWAFAGTVGVWLFAIAGVALLRAFIFRDLDFEEE